MRRIFLNLFVIAAAFMMILSAVEAGSAQRRESRGRAMTKAQVKVVIDRVETRVDYFVNQYDKSLDHSRLNGTSREDWLNKRARDLESATDELRREFDRHDAWIENKDEVRRCLNVATDINKNVNNYHFGAATENNWANVRFELNTLADIYNLPKVGSNVYR
jgi:hypothetical protein